MEKRSISAETLAAFLDGRLGPGERGRVIEQLGRTPDAYESFVDAAAVLLELDEARADAGPLDLRRHRPWHAKPAVRWVAAAAAIGVALLLPWMAGRDPQPRAYGLLEAATLVRSEGAGSVQAVLGPEWDQPIWPVTRGGSPELAAAPRGFRLGVRAAQLELAWSANDVEAASAVVLELGPLLRDLDASGPVLSEYNRLQAVAEVRGMAPGERERRGTAARLVGFLGETSWFELGLWTEQARWAAEREHVEFFAGSSWAAWQQIRANLAETEGADVLASRLELLHRLMGDGVTRAELPDLRERISELIRSAGS
jgi:hypothetical protein